MIKTTAFFKYTGKADYQRKGCYLERNQGVTNFKFESPRVLFNKSDEARSRYSDWNVFMPELVCQCAEAAKKEKFTHFAVRDLGVCLSSSTVSEYYNEVFVVFSVHFTLQTR